MKDVDTRLDPRAGRMEIARSRGAASGFLLVLLGLWGALIPFVGPYFDFAYDPDTPLTWTAARGWLEVLPGAVAVVGGLLLLMSRNRATALLGGWLAVIAGTWFVVGRLFAGPWGLGDVGAPVAGSAAGQVALELAFWSGLGALIIFFGAMALGRVSVHSVRDVRYATRPVVTEPVAAEPVEPAPATVTANEPVIEGHHRRATDVVEEERPRRRGLRDMFGGSRRTPVSH
ncbi:hypothetical protein [Mycolicibacterium rhodesiae]|uniref:Secreted protein n=1 Tax=Mycolicibacterium rhodesiae TaxID=36814 RepID=A0A1X0J5K5_MYCRH|nr:hypothetical protein [Mycolicibacterium rhodesiae]MCV7348203.1 hypothetical protein [Mycolicibacterium rhodesiae]ORB57439.1 hypothetical protein BST42_03515 [Mycolicibacterium rhodesiae]